MDDVVKNWVVATDEKGYLRENKEPCKICGWWTKWLDKNDICEECYDKYNERIKNDL